MRYRFINLHPHPNPNRSAELTAEALSLSKIPAQVGGGREREVIGLK
jgi:hypothetical protein